MKNSKGFTLVELIIAMLVASIIGLSVMGIYALSIRTFEIAQKKQVAMENARTTIDQIAEWVRWGGFAFDTGNPLTDFAGIYPCRASDTDSGSGAGCHADFGQSFGIITEINNENKRLNFYFEPNDETDLGNDAILMMDIIDITSGDTEDTIFLTDGVLMPNTLIPNSNPPLNAPMFVEFFEYDYTPILPNDFPLSNFNISGNGIILKFSLVGISWGSQVDESGQIADYIAVPYTLTVYTRNFMK